MEGGTGERPERVRLREEVGGAHKKSFLGDIREPEDVVPSPSGFPRDEEAKRSIGNNPRTSRWSVQSGGGQGPPERSVAGARTPRQWVILGAERCLRSWS